MIQGYTGDQIFNADETGLNFKILPKFAVLYCICKYHTRSCAVNCINIRRVSE
jgi:hypothetical protein